MIMIIIMMNVKKIMSKKTTKKAVEKYMTSQWARRPYSAIYPVY
jgi:hypothetical protein